MSQDQNNPNQNKNYYLEEEEDQPEVESGTSAVAATKTKNIAAFAGFGAVVLLIIYFSFFRQEKVVDTTADIGKESKPTSVASTSIPSDVAPLPTIPQAPMVTAPSAPPPPPAPVAPTPPPPPPPPVVQESAPSAPPLQAVLTPKDDKSVAAAALKRRQSSIILGGKGSGEGGGSEGDSSDGKDKDAKSKEDKNKAQFDPYFVMEHSQADQQKATVTGNMGYLIAQGKIIDAVLESAINTDVPAPIRAIVSRDVYSESGKNILIPRGSRLIGQFAATPPQVNQVRLAINWTRVIRPDGVDFALDSPAVDQLGRGGAEGVVDNKYYEIFGNAIMLSVINIAFSSLVDAVVGTGSITAGGAVNEAGVTTTTKSGTTRDLAIEKSLDDLQSVSEGIAKNYLSIKPTLTIDQGTQIKVFTKRDLLFPSNFSSGVVRVQ